MQGESPPVLVKESYNSLPDSSCKIAVNNTIQYNTIQYNTVQYNTIHLYIIREKEDVAAWTERHRKQANLSCSIQ